MNFNGFQTDEGQNYSFSAASKGLCALHVIHNYVEKVTLDVGSISSSPPSSKSSDIVVFHSKLVL